MPTVHSSAGDGGFHVTILVEYECDACHRKEPATYCGTCAGHHPPGGWYEGSSNESGDLRHHCAPCFDEVTKLIAERMARRDLIRVVPALEKT